MKLKNIVVFAVLLSMCAPPGFAKKENDNSNSLPPGLQKKLDRGGTLPPGWQKKLVKGETLEPTVYSQSEVVVPVDSKGLITVRIEGKLIKLIEATREVVEIID